MATKLARLGDPISHGGAIIEGSDDIRTNGIETARVGDHVQCALHGLQTIVTGNPNLPINGRDAARVGSVCSCGAVVSDGSPNVMSNN